MAITGIGTVLQIEQTAGVWTTIAEVTGIDLSGITVDIEEVTSLNSGDFKEFAPSYNDSGSMNLNLLFSKDSYQIFYNCIIGKKVLQYKIELPDNTAFMFTGIVSNLPFSIGTSEAIKINLSIKLTGLFVFYGTVGVVTFPFTNVTNTHVSLNLNVTGLTGIVPLEIGWKLGIASGVYTGEQSIDLPFNVGAHSKNIDHARSTGDTLYAKAYIETDAHVFYYGAEVSILVP